MSKLPALRPSDVARVARKLGFVLHRQRGSHAIYQRPADGRIAVIPMHSRDLKLGMLLGLIADLGVSKDEFRKHL